MASGRRRSEVHALDVTRVEFDDQDGSVILYPARFFLIKTRTAERDLRLFFHLAPIFGGFCGNQQARQLFVSSQGAEGVLNSHSFD